MVEYVIALAALFAAAAAMGWLASSARRSAARTAALVASDCP